MQTTNIDFESIKIGEKTIDKQHREIFNLITDINKAFDEGTGSIKVKESINFLLNYAKQHFRIEEILMETHNFPYIDQHKKEHESFTLKVNEISNTYNLDDEKNVNDIIVFLNEWLVNHIQIEDQKLKQIL